jgi:hypothetical protein
MLETCQFVKYSKETYHSGDPKLMAPKIGTETLSPLLPSLTYSTFVASIDFCRDSGTCIAIMTLSRNVL